MRFYKFSRRVQAHIKIKNNVFIIFIKFNDLYLREKVLFTLRDYKLD